MKRILAEQVSLETPKPDRPYIGKPDKSAVNQVNSNKIPNAPSIDNISWVNVNSNSWANSVCEKVKVDLN